ncbi:MAG: hypothetical protein ACE5KI_08260 [Dehalococcoidia bacterium]
MHTGDTSSSDGGFGGLEGESWPGVYLGSYMPFAGVTYYAILYEQDILGGNTRIGPVGWRLPRMPQTGKRLLPDRVLLPV